MVPASYAVNVMAAGFAAAEYTAVRLTVGQERNLTVVLQPAGVTTEADPASDAGFQRSPTAQSS